MFDQDHGVAGVDQTVQLQQQLVDVGRMQAGGGFVQHVNGVAALRALQFAGQLDALRFAAGQFSGGLAQAQVSQPDFHQHLQRTGDGGVFGKERGGLGHGHAQYLGDVATLQCYLQGFGVVACAVAARARRVHAGHEQQFHAHRALAFAGFAAALGHVEGKSTRVVATFARGRRGGETLAYVVEQAGVGGQVGARRAADGFLVHAHQALHMFHAFVDAATDRNLRAAFQRIDFFLIVTAVLAQLCRQQFHQRLADQRRLPRTRDTGHRSEYPKRKIDVQVLHVVAADALQPQPRHGGACAAFPAGGAREQVAARLRGLDLLQAGRRPAVEHAAALLACARTHVDQPVGVADHVDLVFHHEQRIARGLELVQRRQQGLRIGRVQAGGRFVHHVDHAEQVRADLRGQPQALQFARRQRGRAAFQGQVTEPELLHHGDARTQVFGDALRGDGLFGMQVDGRHGLARGGLARAGLARNGVARLRLGGRLQQFGHARQRQAREFADVQVGELHRQRRALQTLAVALRARRAEQVLRDALLGQRALGVGEGMQHVTARAAERAHVAGLQLLPQCALHFRQGESGVHRHHRRFLGVEDPVAGLLRQSVPGHVNVMAQGGQDVALVLAVPGRGPGGHRAFADAQRGVVHHGGFGGVVDAAQAVAGGTGTGRRIRRETIGVDDVLPRRIIASARVQHAQRIGDGGDAAHRRARGRCPALLLQRDRGRQAFDGIDFGNTDLFDQPARVRRDGIQIAALRLGKQGAEGQRGFARARNAGEHHQRIAGNIDVYVLEVVLAGTADLDEALGCAVSRK